MSQQAYLLTVEIIFLLFPLGHVLLIILMPPGSHLGEDHCRRDHQISRVRSVALRAKVAA